MIKDELSHYTENTVKEQIFGPTKNNPVLGQSHTVIEATTRIQRLPEVMERVGLCRASIYQQMNRGSFPRSILIGPRSVGWLEHEITEWLAARAAIRFRVPPRSASLD